MKKTIRQLKQELRNFSAQFLDDWWHGFIDPDATPLIRAIYRGKMSEIKNLVENCGVDVNERTSSGKTALFHAVRIGYLVAVMYLLEHGANVDTKIDRDNSILTIAPPSPPIVDTLIKAGADVNARTQDGQTPLMVMANRGSFLSVKLLAEAGADVNARDDQNATALIFAAAEGHLAIVKYLIEECHADYSIESSAFEGIKGTAQDIAEWFGRLRVFRYLIENTDNRRF